MQADAVARRVDEVRALADAAGRDPGTLDIVYRSPILPEPMPPPTPGSRHDLRNALRRSLDAYRSAGVAEFIVDGPTQPRPTGSRG
jgi:hypothetical protein